ncbi:hypothetical protein [Streptomyces paludis]|uniref:Uncharacterized protein n=1 Tax=Streptomyces paludis TaxID=2282738 RepID=A0A345I0F2_9ACTN|nr:hypothetical protein [Streptomyces paludis]AXG82426.1 hypothetical protein DVK44_07230 [Streptomyces paludis]
MDDAPRLGLPGLEPVPVAGCAVCTALGAGREEARRSGDLSRVSDRNVEIARHPHGRSGQWPAPGSAS